MSLRWRIALSLAVVALAVGAAAAFASYLSTASQLRAGIDQSLRSTAQAALTGRDGHDGHHGSGPAPDQPFSGCPNAAVLQSATAAQWVDTNGTITTCIAGAPVLPVVHVAQGVSAKTGDARTIVLRGTQYRLLVTASQDTGTLEIARSLGETNAVLRRLRFQLVVWIAMATAVAAALGWLIATRLSRPIVRLRDAAHRIATTLDVSTPVQIDGPGEVGSLASSFSTMVVAFGHSQEQQRRLVGDASHEMRTPLTSLRSNVELLGQLERLPQSERAEVVSDVLEDVDELSTLLAELVDLASDMTQTEDSEPVYLGDLARAVATRIQRRTQREITVSDSTALPVTVRPRQIERAIQNLADNAVKYSPATTTIEIAIEGSMVTVRDRGPGISDDDLPRIFDRFYRTVESRTRPGSGLGLSIVFEIVRSHGGQVFARNRAGGGAEVGLSLPRKLDSSRKSQA